MKGDSNLSGYHTIGNFFDISCSICGITIMRVKGSGLTFAVHKQIPTHLCNDCLHSDKLQKYIQTKKEGKEWLVVK